MADRWDAEARELMQRAWGPSQDAIAAALRAAEVRGALAMREFVARRLDAADAEAVRTMMAEDAVEES